MFGYKVKEIDTTTGDTYALVKACVEKGEEFVASVSAGSIVKKLVKEFDSVLYRDFKTEKQYNYFTYINGLRIFAGNSNLTAKRISE